MDTALESLEKLNDLSQWEGVKYNVPVFVEHELWEVPHPFIQGETTRVAILPGQPKPSVGKMLYAIGSDDLTKIAQKINNRLNESGNPVKIFVGHTNLKLPQSEQPRIVGYGCGAGVEKCGPKNRNSVVLKRVQYRKGLAKEAAEHPERSPEFDPLKGELTGLALLKTDPKLPMGLVTYSSTVAGYEGEFRGVVATYASDNVTILYGRQLAENDPKSQDDRRQSATGPDPSAPPNATELQGEEAALADRFMRHYERTNPVIRYMCGKYAQDQQAETEPMGVEEVDGGEEGEGTEQDGEQHSEKPPGKKPGEIAEKPEVHMSQDVLPIQYAQLAEEVKGLKASLDAQNKATESKLATLMATNQDLSQKYAQEQSKRILTELVTEGFVIKTPAKEIERMAKLDDAGRVEYANNIRENYAKADVAPVGPMIGIFDEPTPIPGTKESATSEEVDKVVHYAEKNKIDLDDNGAFEKCLIEIRKTA